MEWTRAREAPHTMSVALRWLCIRPLSGRLQPTLAIPRREILASQLGAKGRSQGHGTGDSASHFSRRFQTRKLPDHGLGGNPRSFGVAGAWSLCREWQDGRHVWLFPWAVRSY